MGRSLLSNVGYRQMVESVKKKLVLTLFLVPLTVNNVNAENQVLERKVLSSKMFNCSDIRSVNIFLTKNGSAYVLVQEKNIFLYMQNNLRRIDKKGRMLLNGFVEKDRVMFAFVVFRENHIYPCIEVYDVQEGFDAPIESVEIIEEMQDEFPEKLVAIPQMPSKYYIFYTREKFSLIQAFTHILSAGHSSGCAKPYLAQVERGKVSKYEEIKYGGKKVEDFFVKKSTIDTTMLHCLGFRQQYNPRNTFPPQNSRFILYYMGYDLEKKKVTQNHSVYEINYDWASYNFGPLSIGCKDDGVFVVFSFHEYPFRGAPQNEIKQITSNIYYFQYSDKTASKTAHIAKGFMPLVKVDSLGNVHVLWIDHEGNLFHKTKKDHGWTKEEVILNNVDIYPAIVSTRYICAEFDKDNNLHVVFPSDGDLIHAKVKLDVTADKQN